MVRRMFPIFTERQRNRVQKALATAPWRESRQEPASRPAVNRKSELFKRTVNYLRGVRPFVPTERIRRRGLVKQFKTAPRFRERVGIRKKLLSMVPAALLERP